MGTSHAALSFVTNTWKSILTPNTWKSILTLALEQLLAGNWLRERRGGWTDRHQEGLQTQHSQPRVSPRDQPPFTLA